MAPANPKRPPRPPRPPGTPAPKEPEVELPFDDDEVAPLQADDPRPQRVPQFPAGSRKGKRKGEGRGREKSDRELAARFDWGKEYSNPGHLPAFLYVEKGPGAGQLVPVQQGPLVLGRSSTSDLRLQHPSISRRHAQITRKGDQVFLKDLSSQNGTFLNRSRVTAELEVMPGDEISLGNAVLRMRGPGGTPAAGIPAISGALDSPSPRKRGLGPLGVGLIAAGVGSTVAALLTVLAVGLSSSREVPSSGDSPRTSRTTPSEATPPSLSATDTAGGDDTAEKVRPTRGQGTERRPGTSSGASDVASGTARQEPRDTQAGASARDIAANAARSTRTDAPPSGASDIAVGANRSSRTGGASDIAAGTSPSARGDTSRSAPSARDIASGSARVAQPESTSLGARDIASGSTRGAQPETASLGARDIASGNTRVAQAAPSSPGAHDIASGSARVTPPESTSRGARDIASGNTRVAQVAPSSPGARDIASGNTRGAQRVDASTDARSVAAGSDEESASAETGLASVTPRDVRPETPGTEADVLRRYEAGEVTRAADLAKVSKLPALHAQLVRYESANAEMRKALAKGDTARAIAQLTVVVRLDQELSQGWSRQGPQLRKQLSDLHVRSGAENMKVGNVDAARVDFEQALKHDSNNLKAREGLRRLSAPSAP